MKKHPCAWIKRSGRDVALIENANPSHTFEGLKPRPYRIVQQIILTIILFPVSAYSGEDFFYSNITSNPNIVFHSVSNNQARFERLPLSQQKKMALLCEKLLSELELELLSHPNDALRAQKFQQALQQCQPILQWAKHKKDTQPAIQLANSHEQPQNQPNTNDRWTLKGQLDLSNGINSNPAQKTHIDSFNLTFDGSVLSLPNSEKPQSSQYTQAHLNLSIQPTQKALNKYPLRFDFQLEKTQFRHPQLESDSDQIGQLTTWWFQPKGAWLLNLAKVRYQQTRYQQISLGHRNLIGKKAIQSIEIGKRRFNDLDILDGNYLSYHWSRRQLPLDLMQSNIRYGIGVTYDRPVENRAGGAQTKISVVFQWQLPWHQHLLQFNQSASWQTDQDGYSPLLDNNQTRKIWLFNSDLQWQYPYQKSQLLYVKLQHQQQKSNLELFTWKKNLAEVGVTIKW